MKVEESLGSICEFVLDGTHGSPVRSDSGIPVLSAQNVRGGILDFTTDRYTTEAEYLSFDRRLSLQAGDVLLTIVGTIGRAAVVEEVQPLVFQRSVAILRPKTALVDSRFLFHTTQSPQFKEQLRRATNTSSQSGVYLGRLKEVVIGLPSLDEQRRIADILDKADELRSKRRAALETLETLSQAIFIEMFGDPRSSQFPMRAIRDLGKVTTGRTPPSAKANMFDGPVPFITPGDLDSATGISAKRSLTEEGALNSRIVRKGSTFVCCIGATIGKTGIAQVASAFNQQINAIEWGDEISDFYGLFAMKQLRSEIKIRGASTTLPLMNKTDFAALNLPVPPISIQEDFEAAMSGLESSSQNQHESLFRHEKLFASLQQKAFQGAL